METKIDFLRAEKLPPLLLTVDEVAEITRMGTRTIWRHVSQGAFPAPIYIGRSARWRRTEIESFFLELLSTPRR